MRVLSITLDRASGNGSVSATPLLKKRPQRQPSWLSFSALGSISIDASSSARLSQFFYSLVNNCSLLPCLSTRYRHASKTNQQFGPVLDPIRNPIIQTGISGGFESRPCKRRFDLSLRHRAQIQWLPSKKRMPHSRSGASGAGLGVRSDFI